MNRPLKLLVTTFATVGGSLLAADQRPNVVWLFAEDTSPWMGTYGHEANKLATPNIDSIAQSGVRFDRAYVPAPVCSACRSSMMVGANQIRFGSHEHRSSRAKDAQLYLPKGVKLLPQILKEAGYSTFNHGKTDYNFVWEGEKTYSKIKLKGQADSWEILKQNQPFFIQFQTKGGKINTGKLAAGRRTDPSKVSVPADYPKNDLYRKVVAQHCDAIRVDDDHIGKVLAGLKASGLQENTIVVYLSDHGANHLVRHKQMPTEGGLHVPFVLMGPEKWVPKQGARKDLVSTLDLTATTLSWAGIKLPEWYEGRNLFAKDFEPRQWVASAKDRLDHTIDRVRTIRTDRFRYTRNYKLDRILLQPQYRDRQDYLKNLKQLYAAGQLSDDLKRIYFGERPKEEFYDVSKDPAQVHNLVGDPKFAKELNRHRKLLDAWLAKGDRGEGEESPNALRHNGDVWGGGRGVNPEYEINREDNDGDGLSDKWEKINGRDPQDGRLAYEFDCGGWQTEGWQGRGIRDNIAGFQGFLQFRLPGKPGSLIRKGLKVKPNGSDQALLIKLRADAPVEIEALANGKSLGSAMKVPASKQFEEVRLPLTGNANWKGVIKSLEIKLKGTEGADLEIDAIEVKRG
ncbi:sulfatase-like hydrolase/transferase [Verrucomicrobia bacterium]|nr:sulfatase-like hydrolase/transferase [Verrucomicrobiota bacterium]